MFDYNSNIPINDKSKEFDYELTDRKFYVGFANRFMALIIDGIILSLASFIILFFSTYGKYQYFILTIVFFIFGFIYNTYMPKKYGGTYGKIALGIKIVKLDGDEIGWREAILRNILELFINGFQTLLLIFCLITINSTEFMKIVNEDQNFTKFLSINLNDFLSYFLSIWVISELIVILFNDKKRAFHDYIAGTVVIYIDYENEYYKLMKNK